MNRIVLLGSPKSTWKEWIFRNRAGSDLLVVDPADTHFGHPGRLILVREDKIVARRFFGALNPARSPMRIVAAFSELLALAENDLIIQLFPYRPHPGNLELIQILVDLAKPDRIFQDDRLELDITSWPIGPELAELETAPPASLQTALRKAHWLKLRQSAESHSLSLSRLSFRGARLGSGTVLSPAERIGAGLGDALHAETCGSTLFVIADAPIGDASISQALDMTHADRAQIASSWRYENLLCAFLDSAGEELGMGFIDRIDFENGEMNASVNAVAPAPVKSVQLGLLYVDTNGVEKGEAKLWEI